MEESLSLYFISESGTEMQGGGGGEERGEERLERERRCGCFCW